MKELKWIQNYYWRSLNKMDNEIKELLKEIKAYRDDMVGRNYPFQQISDIITKWETKKTVSEELQDELEPIRDTSNDPFKGTDIEGKD